MAACENSGSLRFSVYFRLSNLFVLFVCVVLFCLWCHTSENAITSAKLFDKFLLKFGIDTGPSKISSMSIKAMISFFRDLCPQYVIKAQTWEVLLLVKTIGVTFSR